MSKLLKEAKQLRSEDHLKNKRDEEDQSSFSHHGTQEPDQIQTLTTPSVCCISDDFLQNTDTQIMPCSEDFCIMGNNNASPEEYLDQTLTTPSVCCIANDFLQNTDTKIMPYSKDFCTMDNDNALPAENLDDITWILGRLLKAYCPMMGFLR
ncbi:unnamed protein product [Arabis nemorensis]|uniref:Uncharacterized protein n=1 Tax=Arabis nemorensis TaxID=586526 RepID=A0A565B373_9BRAS|nr:unnamed protein product [Arabis nemorensis]